MEEGAEKAGFYAFLVNVFLFIIKLAAGLASGSLAVLSDAFNSFLDSFSYLLAFFSIKIAKEGPDEDHPFGHRRAEPISALVIAIFTGIVGIEILKSSVEAILTGEAVVTITAFTFAVLLISILLKSIMHIFLGKKAKKYKSSSLDALSIDSRNDVFASIVALIGIYGTSTGTVLMDEIAAILLALYILYSGYELAKKNLRYLMGAKPSKEIMKEIKKAANSVKGVEKPTSIRAHYVGDRVHAEISIVLDKKTKAPKTHEIGAKVQEAVEKLDLVERAFIHIDYN